MSTTINNFPLSAAQRFGVLEQVFERSFMVLVATGHSAAARHFEAFVERLAEITSREGAQKLAAAHRGGDALEAVLARIGSEGAQAKAKAHNIEAEVLRLGGFNREGARATREGRESELRAIAAETAKREAMAHPFGAYDYLAGRWAPEQALVERGRMLPHIHERTAAFA